MKIVRPICAGVDVHKNSIVATIGMTDKQSSITEYIQEEFSTLNTDLFRFKDWLLSHNCVDICMESTGKYWIPVYNILEDSIHICLTHPKYVKAIKGKKTDKKDSKWICDLYKHDLVKGSFIPPKEIRALREITRYRFKLICMRSSEKNRFQNSLTVSNIGLASVVSDPLGKTAKNIMREVVSSDSLSEDTIRKLIDGRCKNKDAIIQSMKDYHLESDQRFKIEHALSHIDQLTAHINHCELEMVIRSLPFFDQFRHIEKIPGLSLLSAMLVIAEIGVDMTQFENAKQLVSWAGLAPTNNESANKKKSVRISKAGQYLKPLLVQCALAAIRKKDGYFAIKYERIKKRRGHKKAIIAIARMMLICIYHMILTGEEFKPYDYDSLQNPITKNKQEITIQSALQFLQQSGVDISSIQLIS